MRKNKIVLLKVPCTCGAKIEVAVNERAARILLASLRGAKSKTLELPFKVLLPGDKGYDREIERSEMEERPS